MIVWIFTQNQFIKYWEVIDLSKEINVKVEQIRAFFKKNQPKSHPITEHPISKCDEYTCGLYFDMLCVIAQYENEDTENTFRFIQRIMASCNGSLSITEYSKRAMEITTEKISEFLKQCKDVELQEIFFIDSLLISCANGSPNQKQIEFLAEIGDVIGFDKKKLKYLSDLAVSILEQDSEKYHKANGAYEDEDKVRILEKVICYSKLFVDGIIIDTQKNKYYYSLEKSEFLLKNVTFSNMECIIIENKIISGCDIKFISSKKIILKNCEIKELTVPLSFDSVEDIIIDSCKFTNCGKDRRDNGGAILIKGAINNIKVIYSHFLNCTVGGKYDGRYGGVMQIDNPNYWNGGFSEIIFSDCEFYDCSAEKGAICAYNYQKVIAQNCYFNKCHSREKGLFYSYSEFREKGNEIVYVGENNKFVNCSTEYIEGDYETYEIINGEYVVC